MIPDSIRKLYMFPGRPDTSPFFDMRDEDADVSVYGTMCNTVCAPGKNTESILLPGKYPDTMPIYPDEMPSQRIVREQFEELASPRVLSRACCALPEIDHCVEIDGFSWEKYNSSDLSVYKLPVILFSQSESFCFLFDPDLEIVILIRSKGANDYEELFMFRRQVNYGVLCYYRSSSTSPQGVKKTINNMIAPRLSV